jgi:hypothetical protein
LAPLAEHSPCRRLPSSALATEHSLPSSALANRALAAVFVPHRTRRAVFVPNEQWPHRLRRSRSVHAHRVRALINPPSFRGAVRGQAQQPGLPVRGRGKLSCGSVARWAEVNTPDMAPNQVGLQKRLCKAASDQSGCGDGARQDVGMQPQTWRPARLACKRGSARPLATSRVEVTGRCNRVRGWLVGICHMRNAEEVSVGHDKSFKLCGASVPAPLKHLSVLACLNLMCSYFSQLAPPHQRAQELWRSFKATPHSSV